MTCIYCENNNMALCLSNCYSKTFKCPNCEATLELKQNRNLLTEFQTIWNKKGENNVRLH